MKLRIPTQHLEFKRIEAKIHELSIRTRIIMSYCCGKKVTTRPKRTTSRSLHSKAELGYVA